MAASVTTLARKLPQESSLRPADPRLFRALCWGTFLVAAISLGVAALLGSQLSKHHLGDYALWALLVATADLLAVRVWKSVHFAFGFPLLLACALLYGPLASGLIAFVSAVDLREFRGRISFHHALFNRAQVALSVMAAASVFGISGGDLADWQHAILPSLAAMSADMLVNGTFLMLAQKTSYGLAWKQMRTGIMTPGGGQVFLIPYVAYGFLATIFALLYAEAGVWAFFAFLAPLVLGREVFVRGKRLIDSSERIAAQQGALLKASDQMAAERRDERSHIAAALHDEVLQALFNVSLHAQVIKEDLRSGQLFTLEDDVPRLVRASEEAASLLREVIRGLRESPLGRSGLRDTLDLLVARLREETGMNFDVKLTMSEPPASEQLLIYQVIREALANVARHSGATEVRIELTDDTDADAIRLVIEDDGRGFEVAAEVPSEHFGLALMRERAELAGGALLVESAPGCGTRVVARFPRSGEME